MCSLEVACVENNLASRAGKGSGPPVGCVRTKRHFRPYETAQHRFSPLVQIATGRHANYGLARGPAIPRNTSRARFRRTISSSDKRPTRLPILVLGMVITLS